MKKYILLPVLALSLFWDYNLDAQNLIKLQTDTFTVYGNCEMCKSRIEKSLKELDGVSAALWRINTKVLTVVYNSKIVGLEQIHLTISKLGYKTTKLFADQSGYNELPYCCRVPDAYKIINPE